MESWNLCSATLSVESLPDLSMHVLTIPLTQPKNLRKSDKQVSASLVPARVTCFLSFLVINSFGAISVSAEEDEEEEM